MSFGNFNNQNREGSKKGALNAIKEAVATGVLAGTISTDPSNAIEKPKTEVESKVIPQRPEILKDSMSRFTAESLQGLTDDSKKILESYKKYDEKRDWIANIVYSEAYKNKLIKYEGFTEADVEKRRERVLRDIYLVDLNYYGDDIQRGMDGSYNYATEKTTIKADQNPSIVIHEKEHATTDANLHISVYAENLYTQAYVVPDKKTEKGKYFSDPTEMDARKRSLEYQLESFGLWKYGEPFTEKHLRKILKLAEKKKLYHDAAKFLEITNPQYPKYPKKSKTIKNILLIMNTIA